MGTTTPNAAAALDITSTTKGLLLPRVALTSTTSAAPLSAHVAGMKVYNTATASTGETAVVPGEYYNNGTNWIKVAEGNPDFEPTLTVYVNNSNPNTATTFDDEPTLDDDGNPNPDYVDDPTLEQNTAYAYSGVDGSLWRWNGTAYITISSPAKTEWYLSGTTTDAGSNKVSDISRNGDVGIGGPTLANWKLTVKNNSFLGSGTTKYNYGSNTTLSPAQITSNGSYISYANLNYVYRNVAAGVTDSGLILGNHGFAARSGAGNDGTMSSSTAIRALSGGYGHYTGTGTGTTAAAYGLLLYPYIGFGTITNMYDINVAGINLSGGTIGNHWGLFINNATNNTDGLKKNYIGGALSVGAINSTLLGADAADYAAGKYNFIATGHSVINGIEVGLGKMQNIYSTVVGKAAYPTGTGSYNVAMGYGAMNAATTGQYNTAVGGRYTLGALTTGGANTALGMYALRGMVDGSENIGIGYDAAQGATGGNHNIAMGFRSNNLLVTGADYNIGIGYIANDNVTTGVGNVALGASAGNVTTGSNNIMLGSAATVADPAANQQLSIGNVIYGTGMGSASGKIGILNNAPDSTLDVTGTFGLSTATSGTASSVILQASGTFATPTASTANGRIYIIRNTAAATNVTVNTIIDFGATSAANFTLTPAIGSITIISNGTSWYRIR